MQTQNPNQALATRPTGAVAAKKDLKDWLNGTDFKKAVEQALPKHMTSDRFVRVALTALLKTPKLGECSRESVFRAMLDCSAVGLEPDGRLAHLIPYGNQCQLIIDWKGLVQLAKRSGEVSMWQAHLVCENDVFSWEDGVVKHRIDWLKPRGKTLAVYSHVVLKTGEHDWEIMTLDEVEAIKRRSRAGSSGPWVTDVDEMRKKTVIRRHSKRLTLSPEFRDALEKDADSFEDQETRAIKVAKPVFSATTPEAPVQAPAGFLAHSDPEPETEPASAPEPPGEAFTQFDGRPAAEDDVPWDNPDPDPAPPPTPKVVAKPAAPAPKPAPKAAPAPVVAPVPAPAAPPPSDELLQGVLKRIVEVAGYTFEQFTAWGKETGNLMEKYENWGDIPDKATAMLVRNQKGLLGQLNRMYAK